MKRVLLFVLLVIASRDASGNLGIADGKLLSWPPPYNTENIPPPYSASEQYQYPISNDYIPSEPSETIPDNADDMSETEFGLEQELNSEPIGYNPESHDISGIKPYNPYYRPYYPTRNHYDSPRYPSWGSQNAHPYSGNQGLSTETSEDRVKSDSTYQRTKYQRPYYGTPRQNSETYSDNQGPSTETKDNLQETKSTFPDMTYNRPHYRRPMNHKYPSSSQNPDLYSQNNSTEPTPDGIISNIESTNRNKTGDLDEINPGTSNDGKSAKPKTPSLHNVISCLQLCPMTLECNPVCGTDNITYMNPGRLLCSQFCGTDVRVQQFSTCSNDALFHCANANMNSYTTPTSNACLESCPYGPDKFQKFVCGTDLDMLNIVRINKCKSYCGLEQPFLPSNCIQTLEEMEITVNITTSRKNTEEIPKLPSPLVTTVPVNCSSVCVLTSKKKPVCGTNNITYWNAELLECSKRCGIDVELKNEAPCSSHDIVKPKFEIVIHILNEYADPNIKKDSHTSTESNTINPGGTSVMSDDNVQSINDSLGFTIPGDVLNNIFSSSNPEAKTENTTILGEYQEPNKNKQEADVVGNSLNFTIPDDVLKTIFGLTKNDSNDVSNIHFLPDLQQSQTTREPGAYDIDVRFSNDK